MSYCGIRGVVMCYLCSISSRKEYHSSPCDPGNGYLPRRNEHDSTGFVDERWKALESKTTQITKETLVVVLSRCRKLRYSSLFTFWMTRL